MVACCHPVVTPVNPNPSQPLCVHYSNCQVVQQQQQLQMSFAWSFLHVGQSMTANLFHSKSALSGPKAARRLSERIVSWAMCSCLVLALGTWTFR